MNGSHRNNQWQLIKLQRNWLGFQLEVSYGSYLRCWWLKNKTLHFQSLMKNQTDEIHGKFPEAFEDLALELQVLIKVLLTKKEVLYHKSIHLESRGYLNFLFHKNDQKVSIDFFSKNFLTEKTLLTYFFENNLGLASTELMHHLKKSQDYLQKKNSLTELEILTCHYDLVDLLNVHCSPKEDAEISTELSLRTSAYAATLLKLIGEYQKSFFEKFSDYGLSLISEYTSLRIHLLKFLAILPCLEHDYSGREIKRLFLESLALLKADKDEDFKALPLFLSLLLPIGTSITKFIPAWILAFSLRLGSKLMAKRFIAGENIKKSLPTIRQLSQTGRDATLDQLGELVLCEEEADLYKNKVLEIIEGLSKLYSQQERNLAGILRAHISIKTTALGSQLKPHAFDDCYEKIAPRLTQILLAAKKAHVYVNIDAEHYHFRDVVWNIYSKVLADNKELYSWSDTGIVVQAYLTDAAKHLKDILSFQRQRKVNMPIRLVKGAYWDAETIEAQAHHYDPPQFLNKIETDLHFRQLAYELIADPHTQLVVASHNVHDHCYVESLRATFFPHSNIIEHQCLHMTYEALSVSLVKMGFVVRNYMPVGNLLVGMAYLVRRIMENSSQVGVLKMMRSHQSLNPDQNVLQDWMKAQNQWCYSSLSTYSPNIFENVTPIRLYKDFQWQHFNSVSEKITDIDNLIVLKKTEVEEVPSTMKSMHEQWAISTWRTDAMLRSTCFLQIAEILNVFRDEISVVICHEAKKSITEAYADVDEAIDFVNFYNEQFLKNNIHQKFNALGVVAAITPWNFPFAIPMGMCVAPLMAGNAVVLKSAEQTPRIAQLIERIFHLSFIPKNIFQHVLGSGQTVGRAITHSADLHGLVFTGSVAVGEMLYKMLSGKIVSNKLGEKFIRPVITEMGGKNAIVVTQNAELDETISGILYSAFAHAGQKCSACSRVLVDQKIYSVFKKRLLASISALKVGKAFDPAVVINPVITAKDKTRLIEFKNKAQEEALRSGGRVLLDLQEKYLDEDSIGPLVIELPLTQALKTESYSHLEAFGPIIHLIRFSNLEDALQIANSTSYALTAGLYSQSPHDCEVFMQKIESGNIYVNRPNTGARVGIEPFGGFKLSGTGPKAGGRDYVASFMHDNCYNNLEHLNYEEHSDLNNQHLYPLPNQSINSTLSKATCHQLINSFEREFLATANQLKVDEQLRWKEHLDCLQNSYFELTSEPNIDCPGQKSYSRWDLQKKLTIFWQTSLTLSLKDKIYLITLIIKQIPVVVVANTDAVKQKWNNFLLELQKFGYPKDLIVLWDGSEKQIVKELTKLHSLEIIHISQVSEDCYQRLHNSILQHCSYQKHLPKISSSFSSWLSSDSKNILQHFYHERAFAINVMRHGAPLED